MVLQFFDKRCCGWKETRLRPKSKDEHGRVLDETVVLHPTIVLFKNEESTGAEGPTTGEGSHDDGGYGLRLRRLLVPPLRRPVSR